MDSTPGCSKDQCAGLRERGLCGVRQFKDRVCGYQGDAPWCDRTRERCAALGNEERFDGTMPSLRRPWEGKWWQVVGTLGMLATMAFKPPWGWAAFLYTLFSGMLIPHVRRELYLMVALRELEAVQAEEQRQLDAELQQEGHEDQ